jgi:hypothetical protein
LKTQVGPYNILDMFFFEKACPARGHFSNRLTVALDRAFFGFNRPADYDAGFMGNYRTGWTQTMMHSPRSCSINFWAWPVLIPEGTPSGRYGAAPVAGLQALRMSEKCIIARPGRTPEVATNRSRSQQLASTV